MSSVLFRESDHKYFSEDANEDIQWVSVTTFLKNFKEPFDSRKVAELVSKKRTSPWYKMNPDDIIKAWADLGKNATDLGSWYHNMREHDMLSCDTIQREDKVVPVFKPEFNKDLKKAPDQRLIEGVYPEHFVYLKSAGICGQSDRVEVINGFVDVIDFKTNKELTFEGYTDRTGKTKKMLHCLSHMDDCKISEYQLQLSIYMYMIIKHNPSLTPRHIQIDHIQFEKDLDGIPLKDTQGNPIIKDIITHKLPYLRSEVIEMFKWYAQNKKN